MSLIANGKKQPQPPNTFICDYQDTKNLVGVSHTFKSLNVVGSIGREGTLELFKFGIVKAIMCLFSPLNLIITGKAKRVSSIVYG